VGYRALVYSIVSLGAALALSACGAVEAEPKFEYSAATAEEKQAYLQGEARHIFDLLQDRSFYIGMRVKSVTPEVGLDRIRIKMECTYGGQMDCARPNKYTQVETRRIKTLCTIMKRTTLDDQNLSIKWTEHAKRGGTVMTATANNEICAALKR